MSDKPKVSIISVNFNHKYFPKLSVEAFEASENPWPVEMIFVDNASTDSLSVNFLKQAGEDGRIKFIQSPKNLGFAGGNKLGAANLFCI
jgi:GT2 family glycosyltransferase